jgi:hypothetical protein
MLLASLVRYHLSQGLRTMPSMTVPLVPDGLVVSVLIRPGPSQIAALQAANLPIPAETQINGFLDTGASHSCVDECVLSGCGMKEMAGSWLSSNIGGVSQISSNGYDVEIAIVGGAGQTNWIQVQVAGLPVNRTTCFMLIGLDLLERFTLAYDGPNRLATLSW